MEGRGWDGMQDPCPGSWHIRQQDLTSCVSPDVPSMAMNADSSL